MKTARACCYGDNMANEKISQATAGAPAQATDIIPIARPGNTTPLSLQVSDILGKTASIPTGSLETVEGNGTKVQLTNQGATVNTDVVTYDANGNVQDSGVLIGGLAPLLSPSFTTSPSAPTQIPLVLPALIATDGYVDNNFKGVSVTGFRDDFLNAQHSTAITSAVLYNGDTPWYAAQIAGGTQEIEELTGTFGNPGQITMLTSATTGQGIALFKSGSTNVADLGALGSNAGWEINLIFSLNAQTSEAFRAGVCVAGGATADAPTDGIWVEFDTANSSSNSDFTWVTAKSPSYNYSTTNSVGVDK